MDVYLYTTPHTPLGAVSDCFLKIHKLREMKYLDDNSIIWCNADRPEVGMWALAQRSSHVSLFNAPTAGWIRATRTYLRWGRTARGTLSDSANLFLDLRHIPGSVEAATALVWHHDLDQHIQVVADSSIQRPDSRGGFNFEPFYIIDAVHWKPDATMPPPSEYERASAMVSGTDLLTSSCSEEGAEFVKKNIEAFRTSFDPKDENFISKGLGAINQYAELQQRIIAANVAKVDTEQQWSAPSPIPA